MASDSYHVWCRASSVVAACALFCAVAVAQEYPTRPIRMIVATSPGALGDLVPRIVAPEMARILGQPVVIENKPGANSLIAYDYVARQMPADGYTVASVTAQGLAALPVMEKNLKFDPVKDLPPFIGLVETRFIVGTSPKLPWKTFNEMVSVIKASPGKYNYGSPNTQVRFVNLIVLQELGLDMVHVPYNGGGPFHQAMLVGEIHMGFTSASTAVSFGDRLRILAVTGDERLKALPDVPTFKELGFPQIPGISLTLNVRSGTPRHIVEKLHAAASQALQAPEVRTALLKLNVDILDASAESSQKRLADETRMFANIAQGAGIRPE